MHSMLECMGLSFGCVLGFIPDFHLLIMCVMEYRKGWAKWLDSCHQHRKAQIEFPTCDISLAQLGSFALLGINRCMVDDLSLSSPSHPCPPPPTFHINT